MIEGHVAIFCSDPSQKYCLPRLNPLFLDAMFPTPLSGSLSGCGRGYSDDPLVNVDVQELPLEAIQAPVSRRTRSCHQVPHNREQCDWIGPYHTQSHQMKSANRLVSTVHPYPDKNGHTD